jgi:Tol biopolymer transport system component
VTRALLLAVACAACGRLEFGSRDDAAPVDAPIDAAAPCRTWGTFGAPQLVENINALGMGNDDWHPSLTADDLTLYFYSFRTTTTNDADIWRATRPAVGQPFGTPELVADVSSASYDWSPNLTADGLSLVFASNRPGGTGDFDFYEARRTDPAGAFDTIDELKSLNSTMTEDTAWISPDGLRVYFSSNRGVGDDIWFASRPTRLAAFSSGQLLTELSTPAFSDKAPGLSADELDIFFSSARGTTGFDIWHATRLASDQPFSPPEPIAILNSANDDFAPSLSHDGSELYYSYDALSSGGGDANIFVAKRLCLD